MGSPPSVVPIDEARLPQFCRFLHAHLNAAFAPEVWLAAFTQPWQTAPPNHGFALLSGDDEIVGGIGAIYSTQRCGDEDVRFCNITSWCVLEPFRSQSMRLALSLIQQDGYTITDFSPTKVVSETLKFLKFRPIDQRVLLFANFPALPSREFRVVDRAERFAEILEEQDLRAYRDHAVYPWLRHVTLCGPDSEYCYIIYKAVHRKGLPTANIIHVGRPSLLAAGYRALSSYLLLRQRLLLTSVESRWFSAVPLLSREFDDAVPKNFLSDRIAEADINYLYSETMCLDLN